MQYNDSVSRREARIIEAGGARFRFYYDLDLGLQESYSFDLATGEIVSRQVTGRWVIWLYAALALTALIATPILLFLIIRRLACYIAVRRRGFPVSR